MFRSFSEENGMNGANAMARSAQSLRDTLRIEAVRSMSVLATFHGSVSVRYLLPRRARFMASLRASRKR